MMPDPKTYKQHFENKHPKNPLPAELKEVSAYTECSSQRLPQQQNHFQCREQTLHYIHQQLFLCFFWFVHMGADFSVEKLLKLVYCFGTTSLSLHQYQYYHNFRIRNFVLRNFVPVSSL